MIEYKFWLIGKNSGFVELLKIKRLRALKNFTKHNFLHHEVTNRIAENVKFLNREFKDILEIGAMDDYLSKHFSLWLQAQNHASTSSA